MKDPRPQVPLLRSLEGLRLIASLGIVAIHTLPHIGILAPIGFTLCVDMFFTISGIVMGNLYVGQIHGWQDYCQFLRRRLARIYPLHLATLLFYILLGLVVAHSHVAMDRSRFASSQILPHLLLVQSWGHGQLAFNFPSWSISAEFLLYLLFPALAVLVGRWFWAGLAAVILLFAGGIAWCHSVFHVPLYNLSWNFAWIRAMPSFAFGIWLAAFAPRLTQSRAARFAPHAFVALAITAAIAVGLDGSLYVLLATLQLIVVTAYLSDVQAIPTPASWPPLSKRGHLTYSLYMLHVPVATVFLSFVFPRLLGHTTLAQLVGFAVAMMILFGLAELSFRKFEDPLRRRLR